MTINTTDVFHIYKSGALTVIGFSGEHLSNPEKADVILNGLMHQLEHHECEFLAVDLMNVNFVSSWILGILAAVRRTGVEVELYHPSPEVRTVLETTHLDRLLNVRETEILPQTEG